MMKLKKEKAPKSVSWENIKFQDHKNCFETAQEERKIAYLRKNNDADSLKEDQKDFVKNNKLILKTQQRFKGERHNVFTEEI